MRRRPFWYWNQELGQRAVVTQWLEGHLPGLSPNQFEESAENCAKWPICAADQCCLWYRFVFYNLLFRRIHWQSQQSNRNASIPSWQHRLCLPQYCLHRLAPVVWQSKPTILYIGSHVLPILSEFGNLVSNDSQQLIKTIYHLKIY